MFESIKGYDEYLNIVKEDYLENARLYTKKQYCAYVEWCYSDEYAEKIIEYIRQHLQTAKQIELWNVWLGQKEEGLKRKKCSLEQLTLEEIKEIWGNFNTPVCLEILDVHFYEPVKKTL